jgi:CCR4-NOT complex subunit CAF16
VRNLCFQYPRAPAPVFSGLSLSVPAGARCLLLGANGVGKSTLLRLIAGRHMLPPDVISVLGRPAFHDTALAGQVAFLGGPFPFCADIRVAEILAARRGVDPARRARVREILEVDPAWRMHQVSDGQRRRVQLLLDLERRLSVILLDEVTAELDVLARADLLRFLREESQQAGVTVVYASHVLEGLADWATHLAFLSPGRLRCLAPIGDVAELRGLTLHGLCESWMREDRLLTRRAPDAGP